MTYTIGKRYFYQNNKVVTLNAVWYEDGITWAAISDERSYKSVTKIDQLTTMRRRTQRINLTLELTENNEVNVLFNQNVPIAPARADRYTQTSFDVMVENEEV